jgi:hypothetical protein
MKGTCQVAWLDRVPRAGGEHQLVPRPGTVRPAYHLHGGMVFQRVTRDPEQRQLTAARRSLDRAELEHTASTE